VYLNLLQVIFEPVLFGGQVQPLVDVAGDSLKKLIFANAIIMTAPVRLAAKHYNSYVAGDWPDTRQRG